MTNEQVAKAFANKWLFDKNEYASTANLHFNHNLYIFICLFYYFHRIKDISHNHYLEDKLLHQEESQ